MLHDYGVVVARYGEDLCHLAVVNSAGVGVGCCLYVYALVVHLNMVEHRMRMQSEMSCHNAPDWPRQTASVSLEAT